MSTEQQNDRFVPQLDELLTREQCADWFGQSEEWLKENKDTIVPFRPSHRVVVYHPRTILAKMAFDAGVPIQLVAASYGMTEVKAK